MTEEEGWKRGKIEDKRAGGHNEIKTILVILIKKPKWKEGSCGQKWGTCINDIGNAAKIQEVWQVTEVPGDRSVKPKNINMSSEYVGCVKSVYFALLFNNLESIHPVFISTSAYFEV